MASIEELSGVYGGIKVGDSSQSSGEQTVGDNNTINSSNGVNTVNSENGINVGVYGNYTNIQNNENVTNTGIYGSVSTEVNNNTSVPRDTTNYENADNLITVGKNLPAKTGFWNKVKSVLFKEIKIELNPYEQKIEKEINDFLHQEITWQKVKNFLFQDISFGKKKEN